MPLKLAIADWDYSWMLRTSGRGEDEYHLLPRRMAELAERGFNALRVDAWPHLIAPDRMGNRQGEFVVLPHTGHDDERGSRSARHIHPLDRLVRLAQAAKETGISLWLTTWLLPDTQARRSHVRSPEDFVRIWHGTLEKLQERGVLTAVVALDFAHRFPDQPAGYGAWQPLFHRPPQWGGRQWRVRTPSVIGRLNDYLVGVSQRLRTLYPQLRMGLSLVADRAGQVHELDMSELDFLDLHLTTAAPRWPLQQPTLGQQLENHQAFCRMHRLQPVLTADSSLLMGVTPYLPDLCRLSDAGVDEALAKGYQVINPSRYARPQNELWKETAWLQQINRRILGQR